MSSLSSYFTVGNKAVRAESPGRSITGAGGVKRMASSAETIGAQADNALMKIHLGEVKTPFHLYKGLGCPRRLREDLDDCWAYYLSRYRLWKRIRSTNLIERALWESRRRLRVTDDFRTEENRIRTMYALVRLLNEDRKHRSLKESA